MSPFFLTYSIDPNTPKEFNLDYKQDMSSDIMACLQLARHLARQNIEEQMDIAKQNYDKKVSKVQFRENQQILLDEHYFLNKNKKTGTKILRSPFTNEA